VRARLAIDQLARHFSTAMLCFCSPHFINHEIPERKICTRSPGKRESRTQNSVWEVALFLHLAQNAKRAFLMRKGKLVLLFLLHYTLLAGMSSNDLIQKAHSVLLLGCYGEIVIVACRKINAAYGKIRFALPCAFCSFLLLFNVLDPTWQAFAPSGTGMPDWAAQSFAMFCS
jgi:hypothetical protein